MTNTTASPHAPSERTYALTSVLCVVATLAAVACRKGGDAGKPAAPGASASASAGETAAAPAVAPARCRAEAALAVPGAEDLDLGDAVAFAEGYAVALAHRTAAGRVAGVALVPRDLASARVVDLGPILGDAPPPRLAVRGKELVAAAYAVSKRADARELRVFTMSATGEVRPVASIVQQRDDSLASDLAPALVAWDEALGVAGASPRGVVRVADLLSDHAGPPRDVSPPDSDAEMPRIVALGSGQLVLWLSHRPEPVADHATSAGDAAPALEAVGEARAFTWVEAIALDASGAPVGAVRRLTPATGHVSSFDAMPLAAARPGDGAAVLVVARDDGESVDASGGALLRVRVREDGADPPLALPGDGLGRGAPTLLEASEVDARGAEPQRAWLAWTGPREELRLLPLDAAGAPLGPPSAEPALGEGRPLLPMARARVLVALPAGGAGADQRQGQREGDAGQLRAFACALP